MSSSDVRERLAQLLLEEAGQGPTPRPMSERGRYRASPAQERVVRHVMRHPGTAMFNMAKLYLLSGPLDVAALSAALNEFLRRHDGVRAVCRWVGGELTMDVQPFAERPMPVVDVAGGAAAALAWSEGESARPFDLSTGPLFRWTLLRLGPMEHGLVMCWHHLISDGPSIAVFVRELGLLYSAARAGQPCPLPPLHLQYGDFAEWQRQYLTRSRLESLRGFWRRELAGASPLELACDRAAVRSDGPADQRAGLTTASLGREVTDALRLELRRQGATLFHGLLAAVAQAVLPRSPRSDIVFGTPYHSRETPDMQALFGYVANALPIRLELAGTAGFADTVARARRAALGAFEHAGPLELLEIPMELMGVLHVVYLPEVPTMDLAGLTVRTVPVNNGRVLFRHFQLIALDRADGMAFTLVFNAESHSDESAAAFLSDLCAALERARR